jgi:cytidylate kinase
MPQGFSIAIDGPVASGKGTTAAALADKLGGFFINTGGMYRAVALFCIERGIDVNDEVKVTNILPEVNIEVKDRKILLNGNDVTERIKEPDTSDGSSIVAVYGSVRVALVEKQREIGQKVVDQSKAVIAEGRDAGTKIFPEAALKIFLTASMEVRVKRRQAQEKAKGRVREISELVEDIEIRDKRDKGRIIDPLSSDPKRDGYWVLDNSGQTPEQTAEVIMRELVRKGLIKDDQN